MRIPDRNLAEIWDRGFTVVEGFLDPQTLAEARSALWENFPTPEAYFADPAEHEKLAKSQFAGIKIFPYNSWALNRLPVYPDLLDGAERFLKTTEVDCYKVELWAKYAGAANYDQYHHRDYMNHTLVVPRADGMMPQMTCFILLSEVSELDGPTKVVPVDRTRHLPIGINRTKMGDFFDDEVAVTGPAGSLMIYKTDVFHRGSDFKAAGRSRFAMLVDFKARGWRWQGKLAWPDHAERKHWNAAMIPMTPRQRDVFGWPPIGDPYWNEQTLSDVALRYPGLDLSPYAEAAKAGALKPSSRDLSPGALAKREAGRGRPKAKVSGG